MIYTIGHKESYDKGFEEFKSNPQDFKKMGKRDDYVGGSVFQTYDLAFQFLYNNKILEFDVYGVVADWEKDTEQNEYSEFNNLIFDSMLIKI